MRSKDEHYIIDICDRVLGLNAKRQARFDFLRGDPSEDGRCAMLPVDAYYGMNGFKLVIEYRERQHTEVVEFFDRKQTISQCGRGEQRRRYDQRRRDVLPKHGIVLIELGYDLFAHDSKKRLKRDEKADERVVREKLASYVNRRIHRL
jgi:hypothetical protein